MAKMIRRHLHNRVYLIPGILHMMTSLCFMIYCIRHFHSQTFIVFPVLALLFCFLILPSAVLSIVIGVFYCSSRRMHSLKKFQMAFAIASAAIHGVCLFAFTILIFMGTFDVETMIVLVLFEFVLAVISTIFLNCFSPRKKDEEEEPRYKSEEASPYKPDRKNSFIITRPAVNELPHADQFSSYKNIPYRHTYSSENLNTEQNSPSIQELPNSQNSLGKDDFSSKSFHGKPSTPQVNKLINGPKFSRPGALRVQNLRQCSVNIDDYTSTRHYPQPMQPEVLVHRQNSYAEQGIINLGEGYQNQNRYTEQCYPNIQNNEDIYQMRCAHFINDSYNETGHCDQCYIQRESTSTQPDYYMQEMASETEEDSSSSVDKQSDVYPPNPEED